MKYQFANSNLAVNKDGAVEFAVTVTATAENEVDAALLGEVNGVVQMPTQNPIATIVATAEKLGATA